MIFNSANDSSRDQAAGGIGPATAFTTLSLMSSMLKWAGPWWGMFFFRPKAKVSIKRIQDILLLDELSIAPMQMPTSAGAAIEITGGGDFTWNPAKDAKPTLQNIELEVNTGELLAVVGPVASGKSTLLAVMQGEVAAVANSPAGTAVRRRGTLATVGQEPWILNATLKQNITFDCPEDETKYLQVLNATALQPDLRAIHGGDNAEIGQDTKFFSIFLTNYLSRPLTYHRRLRPAVFCRRERDKFIRWSKSASGTR